MCRAFVTVGSEPFDRLIRAVDDCIECLEESPDLFYQHAGGAYSPTRGQSTKFLDPPHYRRMFQESNVIIAHAGMGSIITAMEFGKPIIVFPRLASLGETRNDHQKATVRYFKRSENVMVADSVDELRHFLEREITNPTTTVDKWNLPADQSLLDFVGSFIS